MLINKNNIMWTRTTAVSCSEVSSLLANRISELDYLGMYGQYPAARDLQETMTCGAHGYQLDVCVGAMNLFEFTCNLKALPHDKYYKVATHALFKGRLC